MVLLQTIPLLLWSCWFCLSNSENPCERSPTIVNGQFKLEPTGEVIAGAASCNQNAKLEGKSSIFCSPIDGWQFGDLCCLIEQCGPAPDVENGKLDVFDRKIGDKALLKCNENSTLFGSDFAICSKTGEWSLAGFCNETSREKGQKEALTQTNLATYLTQSSFLIIILLCGILFD